MDTKVKELITASMDKIHEMADANTIMGTPVQVDGGVTIIPVSKVSYGFAGGGSDLPSKTDKELFGGASGAGVAVTPPGFLVLPNGGGQGTALRTSRSKHSEPSQKPQELKSDGQT